jgi:hypothetical protein
LDKNEAFSSTVRAAHAGLGLTIQTAGLKPEFSRISDRVGKLYNNPYATRSLRPPYL